MSTKREELRQRIALAIHQSVCDQRHREGVWVPLYAADAVLEDLGPELTAYLEDAILETYPDS